MVFLRDICHNNSENKPLIAHISSKDFIKWTVKEKIEHIKTLTFLDLLTIPEYIGTTWRIPQPPKDILYHSHARYMTNHLNSIFSTLKLPFRASLLSVKEKSLGFDRAYTTKITSNCEDEIVGFITAAVETCEVPKKMANSSGIGTRVTNIEFTDENREALNLSIEMIMKSLYLYVPTINAWLTENLISNILNNANEIRNADNDIDKISEVITVLKENINMYENKIYKREDDFP